MSAAGRGWLNRKPWNSLQPSAVTLSSCSLVSTPSAVVLIPRLEPRPTTARTIARLSSLSRQVADEGLVDLDLVEGEGPQIAERGVAGAEVVHRDPDAEVAELVEDGEGALGLLEQDQLGDLEFQTIRR